MAQAGNAQSLRGIAQVDGVNGMILLPDNWKFPSGVTFKSCYYSGNGADYYAAYQTSPTKGGGLEWWSNTYHEKRSRNNRLLFFVIPLGKVFISVICEASKHCRIIHIGTHTTLTDFYTRPHILTRPTNRPHTKSRLNKNNTAKGNSFSCVFYYIQ